MKKTHDAKLRIGAERKLEELVLAMRRKRERDAAIETKMCARVIQDSKCVLNVAIASIINVPWFRTRAVVYEAIDLLKTHSWRTTNGRACS